MTTCSVQNFLSSDNSTSFPDYAIYVACLAAYNNGYLHGVWIDADQSYETIMDEINQMLQTSVIDNAEEWAIHDYSGFGGLTYLLSEYESINDIIEIVTFLKAHQPYGEALLAYTGLDIDSAKQYTENYHGQFDSEEAFAMEFMTDCMDVPDNLAFYLDYEKFARDLFINDFLSIESKGDIFVFSHY